MAVFVPIGSMGETIGQFFKQFGLTVAFAVAFSTIVAFSMTPMVSAHWIKVESEEEADILRVRYENAGNLTVLVVPASDTKPETNVLYQDQAYDMILIAGEFSKFQNELSCMREHLSDNGKLYVADANRLGLKYFAGCQEEYRGGYFSGLENYDKDPERFTELSLIHI